MSEFSFKKGYGQVQQKDAESVRNEIMTELNITTRESWRLRLNGKIEPKISEVQAIESIFNRYGIIEIWGL